MAEPILSPVEQRRKVALEAMDRFADEHGATDRNWREIDKGDHIGFVGVASNGREFWVGYQKETEREKFEAGA